jgi:hypothetical protein
MVGNGESVKVGTACNSSRPLSTNPNRENAENAKILTEGNEGNKVALARSGGHRDKVYYQVMDMGNGDYD